ncbi:hypothetical protein C0995_014158 [Termitomyces sp. Mi166|nr:hypothetical protein C0995_014158 [Termitomyces sp. Mi166\
MVTGSAIFLVYLMFSLLVAPSSLPFLRGHPPSTSDLNILLLQLVVLYYLTLLITVLFLPIGGTYLITVFTACAFIGWLIGAIDEIVNKDNQAHQNEMSTTDEPGEDSQPTESTPLVQRSSGTTTEDDGHHRAIWFIQLLLVVPVPVILVSHIGVILLGAMPQGIVDGGPVWIVYAGISLIATLLILPLAPFIASYPHVAPLPLVRPFQYLNSPKTLFRVVLVAFVISVAYTSGLLGILLSPTSSPSARRAFPFSVILPMKVFFQQKVEIIAPWVTQEVDDTASVKFKTRSTTYLTGLPHYLEKMIVPALPSAVNSSVECIRDNDRKELARCGWSSGDNMLPSPGNVSSYKYSADTPPHAQVLTHNPWLQSKIQISSANTRRIRIRGINTRACRVYFDNAKVAKWSVVGGKPGVQKGREESGTKRDEGLTELRVWSRTWDKEFVIDVTFVKSPQKVKGRVACEWSEYESGRVGLNDGIKSTIPAYEEALRFFPRWATLTKLTDGLVEVWSAFEV